MLMDKFFTLLNCSTLMTALQSCTTGWMNLHSLELLNPLYSCVGQPRPLGWKNPLDSCVGQRCPAGSMNILSLELFKPLNSCVGQPCPGVNESSFSWAVSLLDSCVRQLCPAGWMTIHSLEQPSWQCVGQPCPAGWMNILSLELFHPLDSFVWQPCSAGWMIFTLLNCLTLLTAVSGSRSLQDEYYSLSWTV